MAFKLVIECSKDIDKLHIDFSDGTSVITETPDKPDMPKVAEKLNSKSRQKSRKPTRSRQQNKNDFLATDDDYEHEIDDSIVDLPEITEEERPILVADELQKLDL